MTLRNFSYHSTWSYHVSNFKSINTALLMWHMRNSLNLMQYKNKQYMTYIHRVYTLQICDYPNHQMIWYDVIWYDMIWCDMMWCDMIWYAMIWYDVIWYAMMCYDVMWYHMIWYDMICYDMICIWQVLQYTTNTICLHIHYNSIQLWKKPALIDSSDVIIWCVIWCVMLWRLSTIWHDLCDVISNFLIKVLLSVYHIKKDIVVCVLFFWYDTIQSHIKSHQNNNNKTTTTQHYIIHRTLYIIHHTSYTIHHTSYIIHHQQSTIINNQQSTTISNLHHQQYYIIAS